MHGQLAHEIRPTHQCVKASSRNLVGKINDFSFWEIVRIFHLLESIRQ